MERITVVLRRLRKKGPERKEGFVQLFVSKRLIHGLATAILALFVPIYLYQLSGEQFWFVGLFYALIGILYVGLLVPGMKLTNKIGFSPALALSMVFAVAHYIGLYYSNEDNIWQLLPFLVLSIALFRLFHWVPYHVDFTSFTRGGERGRDVSLMFATIAFMGMVGPTLGGFIVSETSYAVLFGVGIVLLAAAGVSYFFVPAVEQQFTWTFGETIKNMFGSDFRNIIWGDLANGAESIVNLIAWPLFLYTILNGNVLEIGILSTVIVGVTIIIQLVVGKYLDAHKSNSTKTLRTGSVLYAVGWIVKMFVLSTVQVFLIGLYHNITRIFIKTPYSSILYDMSGDQGQYVDEFTVMREMAHHSGRVLGIGAMIILTFYISIEWTFVLAAAASIALNVVYRASHSGK